MSGPTNPDPDATRKPDAERCPGKSAYVKPSFRREQVFETMALACGKISTVQQQCRNNLKTS